MKPSATSPVHVTDPISEEEEEEESFPPFEEQTPGIFLQPGEPVTEMASEGPPTDEFILEVTAASPPKPVPATIGDVSSIGDGMKFSDSATDDRPTSSTQSRRALNRPAIINHDLLRELEVDVSSDSRETTPGQGTLGMTPTDMYTGLDFSD
jgi:hypothetical protein